MADLIVSTEPLLPAAESMEYHRHHYTVSDSAAVSDRSADSTGENQTNTTTTTTASVSAGGDGDGKKEEKCIWVLDPMTRKLRVPLHLLVPTQATASSGTVPSLCIAYLEGRCRHPWCRQAHVLPSAIPQLRDEALNAPTCCRMHNDPHDISKLTAMYDFIRITNNSNNNNNSSSGIHNSQNSNQGGELIPSNRVASTVGLLRYLVHHSSNGKSKPTGDEAVPRHHADPQVQVAASSASDGSSSSNSGGGNAILDLPAKFVCRLHLAHRCRYLEDCNNIHVCREYEAKLQPPPQVLSALHNINTNTRTVNVGDVCYSVTPLAVGDIDDEDFASIVETQKLQLASSGFHTNSLSSAAASSVNSPMRYPGMPLFAETPMTSFADPMGGPNISPLLGSSMGTIQHQPQPQHLRVYDVRSRAPGGGSSHTSPVLSAMNANSIYNNSNAAASMHDNRQQPHHRGSVSPKVCALSMGTDCGATSGEGTPVTDGGYGGSFLGRASEEQQRHAARC